MNIKNDKNFDDLSSRFRKNIYDSPKGKIRLEILWRDIVEKIPQVKMGGVSVLDVGAGQGNFSLLLAQNNNDVTLCDLSEEMLQVAQQRFAEAKLEQHAQFIHSSLQNLSNHTKSQYDVVLFHAVLEWLSEPRETLQHLMQFIKPGGYLSLMFYSRTGLIYNNLTHGNFDYVLNDALSGKGKSLTPTNPQDPEEVCGWLNGLEMETLVKSGVRVFYDGMSRERRKQINLDDLIKLEKRFSRQEPYSLLARYIHILAKKN